MSMNTYYLELMFILLNIFQSQELMNKTTKVENLFLKKKRQEALEKKLGCKFIRVNASDDTDYEVNKVQIFISKFKRKNEIKIKQNKRTRKRNKIIKTSINKSKFISCQKMFYQITKNEKHTIKNKINKSWKKTWSNELFGV